jgi:two-component system sensor histidine kinase BaeS
MRSLRLRFFLISWPLVVAAIAIVALSIDRFSKIELETVEVGPRPGASAHPIAEWTDAIAMAWPPTDAQLARMAARADPPVDLIVISSDRARIATTDQAISEAPGEREKNGAVHLQRVTQRGGRVRSEADFMLMGAPVRDFSGVEVARLFVVPRAPEPTGPGTGPGSEAWRARLRRTLWIAAIAASIAAAAAALLLAGPLVRQVRRLTQASTAIGSGALDARVGAKGNDELAQLGRTFDAMAEKLQQAEAHKRNVVTDVAHELRTPLTNIIGMIESMQDGIRPADAATLSSLRDEAGLLASLVDELQELSLAESGQLAFQIESVDAVAAARTAVDAIAPSSGDVIVYGPAEAAPVLVRADARRLAQILRNLLRNAITHTPSGGRVIVTVEPDGARVAITVADTGRGIPAEHIPLIWERFHRVDRSRDRASGGMGIGLALVRQLIADMGGEVGVTSEVGRGSRFRVVLTAA